MLPADPPQLVSVKSEVLRCSPQLPSLPSPPQGIDLPSHTVTPGLRKARWGETCTARPASFPPLDGKRDIQVGHLQQSKAEMSQSGEVTWSTCPNCRNYQQERGMLDRQAGPFHPLGRVLGEARAAATTAHTSSLWKIPSIDSALIRQSALGISPRFLLGQLRSKREPERAGLGAGAALPFPSSRCASRC